MVIIPSTGVSRYHNCCIDGGTTLENFGYHLVQSRYLLKIKVKYFRDIALVYSRIYLIRNLKHL